MRTRSRFAILPFVRVTAVGIAFGVVVGMLGAGCGATQALAPTQPDQPDVPDEPTPSPSEPPPPHASGEAPAHQPTPDSETSDASVGDETTTPQPHSASPPRAAVKLTLAPFFPAPAGPAAERLLIAMRRQLFIASVTDRARAWITLAAEKPKDPNVARVHKRFVAAQWAIEPGRTYLEGMRGDASGFMDQRTAAFSDALMQQIERRGLVERSVDAIEPLAAPPTGPAFGVEGCHDMRVDLYISRPQPESPNPLRRPTKVSKGSRADIVVRIARDGASNLAAAINASPKSSGAQACFAAVSGTWSVPRMSEHFEGPEAGHPTAYCRLIRCVF